MSQGNKIILDLSTPKNVVAIDETHDSEPSCMNLQPTPSVVNPKRVACTEVVTSTTESDSDSTVIQKLKRKLQVEVKTHARYTAHHHQVAP